MTQQILERTAHVDEIDDSADPYGEATAEFYDLLACGMWDHFGPDVARELAHVDPTTGPIVDVGAGTGIGLSYIHRSVPTASILAIEPSRAMRSIMHTRLALSPELLDRVTVMPFDLCPRYLPDQISGMVASAVLGHFDETGRHDLWQMLADRLAPGAPAIIGVLPPIRPMSIPPTRYRALPVGQHVYEGWMSGDPIDDRRMRWTMTYRVLSGDAVLLDRTVQSLWTTSGPDDVELESRPYGLLTERPEDPDAGYVTLRRR